MHVSNTSVTAPDTPDIYYYGACVDSVSNESDTTNNCSTAVEITVLAPPDLVVDTPEVGGRIGQSTVTLSHGQSFDLYTIVRNQGNDLGYSTTVHYYLSTDATITTSDTVVGTKGSFSTGPPPTRMSLTAPTTSGTYYYGACVEPVAHESATTNNCSDSLQAIVEPPPAPDLVVDTPTVSQSILTTGGSFTLSFTVRNQGNRSSGPITLRYYRSDDADFDDDDTLVGTQETDTVVYSDRGRSFTSDSIPAHRFFAPSSDGLFRYPYISDGTYYYIVCVDQGEGESDITNNCSTGIAVKATSPTSLSNCIVGYVLTPLDKCLHTGTLVAYGEIDAFNSGLGRIYFYSESELDSITRSVSGSGPGNRQTSVHIRYWGRVNVVVKSVLTSAGNERIVELSWSG